MSLVHDYVVVRASRYHIRIRKRYASNMKEQIEQKKIDSFILKELHFYSVATDRV